MVVPWLYVGMLFASFCWHVEDHYAHSVNYMHWGAPKTWYGVRGDQADQFEEVMRQAVPDLVESEAGLLYKMVTMVPPTEAIKEGVQVCHLIQKPGTFVITFPRAYHAGFSHGLNCAESSNFATPDWLPWGKASVDAFRTTAGARRPCFTHEMLLTTLARKASSLSAHIASWVEPELRKLIAEETAHLEALREAGVAMDGEAKEEDVPNGGGLVDAAAPQEEVEAKAAVEEGMAVSTEAAAVAAADAEPAPDVELPDAWSGACPECAACKYECFLSSVACTAEDGTITHLSPMHALGGEKYTHRPQVAHKATRETKAHSARLYRL